MNIVSQETIDKYRLIPESFRLNVKTLLQIKQVINDLGIEDKHFIDLIYLMCKERSYGLPIGALCCTCDECSMDKISLLEIVEEYEDSNIKEFMECFLKLIDSDSDFREVYYLNVMS